MVVSFAALLFNPGQRQTVRCFRFLPIKGAVGALQVAAGCPRRCLIGGRPERPRAAPSALSVFSALVCVGLCVVLRCFDGLPVVVLAGKGGADRQGCRSDREGGRGHSVPVILFRCVGAPSWLPIKGAVLPAAPSAYSQVNHKLQVCRRSGAVCLPAAASLCR